MRITKITMKNWCSFYGTHELELGADSNRSSYVIFGQIGKGKSSIVAAVEWALFGEVMDSMQDGDEHILRQKRPIVDAGQFNGEFNKFALPLMVDRAYREGDYNTEVALEFIHNEFECKLVRTAYPSGDGAPKNDADMNMRLHLSIGEKEHEHEFPSKETRREPIVQPMVNEIIPPDVSRFFFVKGDSIREFTGLIFGSDSNPKMKDAVNSVVGLPALTRSLSDFRQLRSQCEDKANRYARKVGDGDGISKQIDGTLILIQEAEEGEGTGEDRIPGIKQLESNLAVLEDEIRRLEAKLSEQSVARNLLSKKERLESELEALLVKNPKDSVSYREALKSGWKIVIQNTIESSVTKLEADAQMEQNLKEKIRELERDLPHDIERLTSEHGAIPCDRCNVIRPAFSVDEKIALENSIKDRKDGISDAKYDLSSFEGSRQKMNEVLHFKTDTNLSQISTSEAAIRQNLTRMEELQDLIAECNKSLIGMDADGYRDVQNKLDELKKRQTLEKFFLDGCKSRLRDLNQSLEELRGKRSRTAPPEVKKELAMAQTKSSAYAWLHSVWEKSLETYREKIRKSIDEICTKQFLEWVDEPKKYSKVETSPDWSLTVYGADGHWAPLGNPGHRQLLSLSFIESLRQNSNIEFPLIFDNPGAAVDQETISGILDFYLNNPPSQFIALSHSGGMREAEMMSKYHQSGQISKAWRVDYVEGKDRHSKFEQLNHEV